MLDLVRATAAEREAVVAFLSIADLTISGLDSPSVHVWIARDVETNRIVVTTGFELSDDGQHALIRSVAVDPAVRGGGLGLEAARFAIDRAAAHGAHRAWLFSRRSGPFWQKLGFTPADRSELAAVLASTHQVQLFVETGQLLNEVAWSMPLVRTAT